MLLEVDQAHRLQMRIVRQRLKGMAGLHGDVRRTQDLEPLLGRAAGQWRATDGKPLGHVARTRGHAREPCVVQQIVTLRRLQEGAHLRVGVDGEGDPAVGRLHGLVVRAQQAQVARRADRRVETLLRQMLLQHERRHGLEHGHLDAAARAADLAFHHRRQDGARSNLAGNVVADEHRHIGRRTIASEHQPGHARRALHDAVVGRKARVGTVGAITGDQAVDLVRMARSHGGRVQSQPLQRLRTHVGDDHVGRGNELVDRLPGTFFLQVQADVALAAVEVQVGTRMLAGGRQATQAAHQVALRALHLHDLGAVLAQTPGAHGADDHAGQVQDAHALQGFEAHWISTSMSTARTFLSS